MNTIEINDELKQNFIDYAYEVNSNRAFPDARDGFKEGARSILWCMYEKGYASNKPHVKSAKVSGAVAGEYHPHGISAIYETFVHMAQPWNENIPEIDFHGNMGNQILGSNAYAADRYSEVRLSKSTEEGLLKGIKKDNVPMKLNFSEDQKMPVVLPAIYPRLLVNGSQGIGLAHSQYWCPYNLKELTKIINTYIQSGELNYSKLYPDFPTGGIIINKDDMKEICKTGKGKIILRAKTEIKDNLIFITELPYQVYVEPLLNQIVELIKKEEITNISNYYNKTDKNNLLIEIECNSNPDKVLRQLFEYTDLQKAISVNQNALIGKTPKLLNLQQYLDVYIEHNLKCIQKEYQYDYKRAKERLEIVLGLLKAIKYIDSIITLIKESEDIKSIQDLLVHRYDFTDNQAKAIINMKISSLCKLENNTLEKEAKELKNKIEEYKKVLENESEQKNIFLNRLNDFTEKYGYKRHTKVIQLDLEDEKFDESIDPVECMVIIGENNLIKRIPMANYTASRRSNKKEPLKFMEQTDNTQKLYAFTSKGKVYKTTVGDIPEGRKTTKGEPINAVFNFEDNEKPLLFLIKPNKKYISFITEFGYFKKTKIEEYMNLSRGVTKGIRAIGLKDGDSVVSINLIDDNDEFMLITKLGMAIRFNSHKINPISKDGRGVRGVKLKEGDSVLLAMPIHNEKYLLVLTKYGQSKKIDLSEFTVQSRGGSGIRIIKDNIIADCVLTNDEDNVIINEEIVLSVKDIPSCKRSGKEYQLINNKNIISVLTE